MQLKHSSFSMANVNPECPDEEELGLREDSRDHIEVLILATKWQHDSYGISTINKSLIHNLRFVDPEAKKIKITSTVLKEEVKIPDADLNEAKECGVKLKGAKQPRGSNKKPNTKWLNESIIKYYGHVPHETNYDFIIGHAPYLANGCLNVMDWYHEKQHHPKVMLIIHGLPRTDEGQVDEELLLDWLTEADVVFSMGMSMQSEIIPYIRGLESKKQPIHKVYIPMYPLEFFETSRTESCNKVQGTQNITIMTAERKNLAVTGLDFPLAVSATAGASAHVYDFDGVRSNLIMLGASKDEKQEWRDEFERIMHEQHFGAQTLSFQYDASQDMNKMKIHMRKSNLFLLPTKLDSPLFGTETLAAIAAGVPVLVSRYSGLAALLYSMIGDESVVYTSRTKSDMETWKERIIQRLLRPQESQQAANRLREQLLLDSNIAETQLEFINTIVGTYVLLHRCKMF